MSPKARATKSKARLQRYDELQRQQYDAKDGAAQIQIPTSQSLGDLVIRAENLTKSFGTTLIF
ncbi:MAG: energy-dependent translational throttle protein EttA, partial [Planctomycetota bacterium]|nr:energy-dependent translational throttle protein EttA [Planctomycetota bacterium]